MVILESNDIVGTTHNHSNVPHDVGSASDDTRQAVKGSNFGLPIALELTALMQGSIGIDEVRMDTLTVHVVQHRQNVVVTLRRCAAFLSGHTEIKPHDLLGGTSRRDYGIKRVV